MINENKPPTESTNYLDIGSGFTLLIGDIFRLVIGEGGSLFINTAKVTSVMSNVTMTNGQLWSRFSRPWQLSTPWTTSGNGITNNNKP